MTNNPTHSDEIPDLGFDPIVFWEQHKGKIIAYTVIVVAVVVGVVAWQIAKQRKVAESRQLFAQASTVEDYQQIVQKFPRTVVAGDATLLLAEKLRGEKKYDEALAALKGLINDTPDYPLIDAAWLGVAVTQRASGKADEALATYQQIVTQYATSFSAPQALLAQGEILKEQGKTEEAKQKFENIKAQYPDSFFVGEATRELSLLKK